MKINIGACLKIFAIIALFNIGIFAQRNLANGYWELNRLNGRQISDSNAVLDFDETGKKISGNAGCNKMSGSYSASRTRIRFSEIGTTKMFCVKSGLMKDEAEFTRTLASATRYSVYRRTLRIYSGRKQTLQFELMPITLSSFTSVLAEKKWYLDGQKERTSKAAPKPAFIVFDMEKGSAGGNTGCNSFGGKYKIEFDKLTITNIISTERACTEDDSMDTERKLLDGLRKTTSLDIKEDQLLLYEKDTLLLTFTGYDK
jgi:heat shock protein HslJ